MALITLRDLTERATLPVGDAREIASDVPSLREVQLLAAMQSIARGDHANSEIRFAKGVLRAVGASS